MLESILQTIGGLAVLVIGAQLLVRGGVAIARRFGLSDLLVGLTIVAYGTSAPELSVAIQSALAKETAVAVGNAVGANIYNMLVILGITALVHPIRIEAKYVRREMAMLIAACAGALLLMANGWIGRLEAVAMLLSLGAVTWYSYRHAMAHPHEERNVMAKGSGEVPLHTAPPREHPFAASMQLLGGLVLLYFGSELLLDGILRIAELLAIPTVVAGLLIASVGTAAPELAASIVAARRGNPDLAVGNVMGSNLFNMLAVLGAAGAVSPVPVPDRVIWYDAPVMVLASIVVGFLMRRGERINRTEGAMLLGFYGLYAWIALRFAV